MVFVNLLGTFWFIQVSSGWGQSSPQETGAAGHGPTTETLAVQTPRQPLPHQDGEGLAGSGLAYDTGAGKRRASARKHRWWNECEVKAGMFYNEVHLCRFPTGSPMPGGGWRTPWDSLTWAGRWGSNCTINTSRETLSDWACAVMTATQKVRATGYHKKTFPTETAVLIIICNILYFYINHLNQYKMKQITVWFPLL